MIICWYLTTLAVLVSWTLHPRERNSGSINVDLIAVLTLPAVAAGHLVSQVRGVLHQAKIVRADSADWKYLQSVPAIEAPFIVTETFMAISVILFIVDAWKICIRRAIFVALVGLLCFTVECYIHFSEVMDLDLRYEPGVSDDYPAFSRFFVADFAGLVIAILVVLSLCGLISAAIAFCMLPLPRTASSGTPQDAEIGNEAMSRERRPSGFGATAIQVTRSAETTHGTRLLWGFEESCVRGITMVTTLFLPVSFIVSLLPLSWHITDRRDSASATTSLWQTFDRSATRLVRDLSPRTAYSITDLDQVVAASSGATVLGFRIYSVAKAYYKIWNVRRSTSSVPTGTE